MPEIDRASLAPVAPTENARFYPPAPGDTLVACSLHFDPWPAMPANIAHKWAGTSKCGCGEI